MSIQIPIVRICEVISVEDKNDGDRIKVHMSPEDNHKKTIDEYDYCFPLLPKMLHVKPKVGESVMIFTAIANDGNSQRYYIGPVISQPTHMEEEPHGLDSMTLFKGAFKSPDPAPSMNPETNGAFPNNDDINIEGRRNCGIQITEDDVRIKAGVKLSNPVDRKDIIFNKKNPSYLKLKYHEDKTDDTYKSTATLVADEINLISNNSNTYFETTDNKDLITDKTMDEIIEKAHQLPYGDILIEFLTLFREAFLKHTHNFISMPTCPSADVVNLSQYNLKDILSNNIRIN